LCKILIWTEDIEIYNRSEIYSRLLAQLDSMKCESFLNTEHKLTYSHDDTNFLLRTILTGFLNL
jgi:hypothetical protein